MNSNTNSSYGKIYISLLVIWSNSVSVVLIIVKFNQQWQYDYEYQIH